MKWRAKLFGVLRLDDSMLVDVSGDHALTVKALSVVENEER